MSSTQAFSEVAQLLVHFQERETAAQKILPWLKPKSEHIKQICYLLQDNMSAGYPQGLPLEWVEKEIKSEYYGIRFLLFVAYHALQSGSREPIVLAFQRKESVIDLSLINYYVEALIIIRDRLWWLPALESGTSFDSVAHEEVGITFDCLIEDFQTFFQPLANQEASVKKEALQ